MEPKKKIWHVLEESAVVRLLKSAHELVIIAIFYTAIFGVHLNRPSVEINYSVEEMDSPIRLAAVLKQQPGSQPLEGSDSLNKVAAFIASPKLLRLEIANYSSERVSDFEMKVAGVVSVSDIALSSTSAKLHTKREHAANVVIDNQGTLTLPNLEGLPPDSYTKILIWGQFLPGYLGPLVKASGAIDRIAVKERQTASGVGLFVARNIGSLTLLLILYLATVSSLRYRRKRDAIGSS